MAVNLSQLTCGCLLESSRALEVTAIALLREMLEEIYLQDNFAGIMQFITCVRHQCFSIADELCGYSA